MREEALEEKVARLEEDISRLLTRFGEETGNKFVVGLDVDYIYSGTFGEVGRQQLLGRVAARLEY